MAPSSTASKTPHRSKIFWSVGLGFSSSAPATGAVRSAPQCGHTSVAVLMSFSHSRHVNIADDGGSYRAKDSPPLEVTWCKVVLTRFKLREWSATSETHHNAIFYRSGTFFRESMRRLGISVNRVDFDCLCGRRAAGDDDGATSERLSQ